MAAPISRSGIILDLLAFLGVGVFCVSTQAPLIQQDILKRSQDALLMHRLSIRGLAVDGRDVVLSGLPEAAVANARARVMLEQLPGVRTVRIRTLAGQGEGPAERSDEPRRSESGASLDSGSNAAAPGADSTARDASAAMEPATSAQQKEIQTQIDRALEEQGLTFVAETSALTRESELVLDKIATYLAEAPNLACEIRGYDSHPREVRQNWVLALQRALATEDYLETRGVAEWRLSTHAFQIGEGTEGRRTDRVVDLVVKAR